MKVTELTSAKDMADSISAVSSAAQQASVDINTLNGYTTSMVSATGISGSEAGTALKTAISRTFRLGKDGVEDDGKTGKVLEELGIKVRNAEGQFRSFKDIIDDSAKKFKEFNQAGDNVKANYLTQAIGGTEHYSKITALLKNYDIALEATEKSINSQNSALQENEKYLSSIEGRWATFKVKLEEIAMSAMSSNFLKGAISGLDRFAGAIKFAVDNVGILGIGLAGLGVYLTNTKDKFKIFDIQGFSLDRIFNNNINDKLKTLKTRISLINAEMKIMSQSTAIMNGQMNPTILQKMSAGFNALGGQAMMASGKVLLLKGATMALNSIVGIGIGVLSSLAIGVVITGITNLINKQDELKQKTQETIQAAQGNIDTNNQNIKSLTDLSSEYETLSSKTHLSVDEQKKLNEVRSQIGSASAELIKSFDSEGVAILESNQKIREYIESLKEKNRLENVKIVNAKIENEENDKKEYDNSKAELKSTEKDLIAKKNFLESIKKSGADADWIAQNERELAALNSQYEEAKGKVDEFASKNKEFLPTLLASKTVYSQLGDEAKKFASELIQSNGNFATMGASGLNRFTDDILRQLEGVNIKEIQDSLNSKLDELKLDFNGKFDTAEFQEAVKKMIYSLPELKEKSKEFKDTIVEKLSVKASEIDTSGFDKTKDAVNGMTEEMDIKKLGEEFNKIRNEIQGLNDVLYQMDKGELKGSNLDSAISKYPLISAYLNDEIALRKYLTDQLKDQEAMQLMVYEQMIANDNAYFDSMKIKGESARDVMENLYSNILSGHKDLLDKKNSLMEIDLSNAQNLAEAKGKVEENLIKSLLGMWSEYYNATTQSISFSEVSKDKGRPLDRYEMEDINSRTQALYNAQQKIQDTINQGIKLNTDFKNINMGKSQIKDQEAKAKKDAKDKTKKDKEAFNQDVIANQQKKLSYEMEKYNKLLEKTVNFSKQHLENLKQQQQIVKAQIELTKKNIAYQDQLSRTASPPANSSSNGSIDSVLQNAVDNYTNHKVQYKYGGKSLETGIDCSAFVSELYKQMGIDISGNTATLSKEGVKVDKNSLQKGDMIFFKGKNQHGNGIGHVGMYIGNGQYIHASNERDDVKVSSLSSRSDFVTARRVINSNNTSNNSSSSVKPVGGTSKQFTVTYYTDLPSENGGYTTNAYGQKLAKGMVASNVYKKGTPIYLEGIGNVTVADTGGKDFNKDNRLDVFIPRNQGESDSAYLKRVNNMGKKTVSGTVGGVQNDTPYITNENRQKSYDELYSALSKKLELESQDEKLNLEIKLVETKINENLANVDRLQKLIDRSNAFYDYNAKGSVGAINNLNDVAIRTEETMKTQLELKDKYLKLSKDTSLTESQRYEMLTKSMDAEINAYKTRNDYAEAYLKTIKETLFAQGEVQKGINESIKKRNLTRSSFYMENTSENLHHLKQALEEQRKNTSLSIKEKNDAYKLFNDEEYRKKLTPQQLQNLTQEYYDKDGNQYEQQNQLKDDIKKVLETELEISLKPNKESIEKLKNELEIANNLNFKDYELSLKLNENMVDAEFGNLINLETELDKVKQKHNEINHSMELYQKNNLGDPEYAQRMALYNVELQAVSETMDDLTKKIEEQRVALSQQFSAMKDAEKALLDNKAQKSIFGMEKEDYEDAMNDRLRAYNKQLKAIEEEAKYLTEDEKKWQLELIKDDINSQKLNLDDPAQRARIEAYEKQVKQLEGINKLEQDRVDKLKYQLDIEKAKIKLENLQKEKTIRALKKTDDGSFQWTYVADQDLIDQAQKDLKEKQYEYSKWTSDKDREDRREAIQNKIDAENEKYDELNIAYEKQMKLIEKQIEAEKVAYEKKLKDDLEAQKKFFADKKLVTDTAQLQEKTGLTTHNQAMNATLNDGMNALNITNEEQWDKMVTTTQNKILEMEIFLARLRDQMANIKELGGVISNLSASKKITKVDSEGNPYTYTINSEPIAHFDSGGFTGSFSGGKLAMLHEKELILNKTDTSNILEAVKNSRGLANIKLPNIVDGFNKMVNGIKNSVSNTNTPTTVEQHYHISKMDFPNVKNGQDIREAIMNLPQAVVQFSNKTGRTYVGQP